MNPVDIEEAVSQLALEPFDRAEFPFQFLAAFGNKETALKQLKLNTSPSARKPQDQQIVLIGNHDLPSGAA